MEKEHYICQHCRAVMEIVIIKIVGQIYPRVSVCTNCGAISCQKHDRENWHLVDSREFADFAQSNPLEWAQMVNLSEGYRRATV